MDQRAVIGGKYNASESYAIHRLKRVEESRIVNAASLCYAGVVMIFQIESQVI